MTVGFLEGNQVELLESGIAYFPALIRAIDDAREEVCLETYIFEDDDTGREVAAALCRAAERGIRVKLMIDGFGGRDFPEQVMPRLSASGVAVLVYRPELARMKFRRHRLRRLHRKIAVVDGQVAFVGGINIIDDMHTPNHTPPRFDYAVRIRGPLLEPIHRSARRLWELVAWANFKKRLFSPPPQSTRNAPCGSVRAAFLVRDNFRHRRDIEDAYMEAIAAASEDILIANAYFLPGRRFRRALVEATARGVRVVLLLQGRVEYVLLHYASQALYGSLLDSGVRIFEYHRSFLHAKVAVVDRHWATVGSSNIDPFSLLMAREANVVVSDIGFAASLRASLERAMQQGANELRPEDWKRKPLAYRFASWLAYGVVRVMIGLAGYGGKH